VLTPLAWQDSDDAVRLGRITEWYELAGDLQVPAGQKVLLADEQEVSILELRELDVAAVPAIAS
jgi:type VI secretion system protein ImpE